MRQETQEEEEEEAGGSTRGGGRRRHQRRGMRGEGWRGEGASMQEDGEEEAQGRRRRRWEKEMYPIYLPLSSFYLQYVSYLCTHFVYIL